MYKRATKDLAGERRTKKKSTEMSRKMGAVKMILSLVVYSV